MSSIKQPVIFCDFDGTITLSDNIVAIMKHFKPAGYEAIMKQILAHDISIHEGVGAMFALLPSSMKKEITDFVLGQAGIRDGFEEFLNYVQSQHIPFYVTSGGIDFFVKPLLAPFPIADDHIYCNGSNFSGSHIEITWPHPCDEHCSNDCGMCKTTVMRQFPIEQYERILIGDSLTDFEGAKLADRVYSRSALTVKCKELGIAHTPFETFHEIQEHIEKRLGAE
ncbi:2-hydroxy-3-keto-5-methylthiopentenyl-1-phosphate phosphatase [Paenibacillus shirakamiensis]|uniref:2-hydroxy-3-keto-5-methylthiopentenyl-1-phosphate phosphatase n=1 Tax=Paenibacillus shirakamiensis TaxID=1265935 RepID=A0ABS4JD05_9BACL|nr:2-hydroxy-3-keto-5-methylthiopentenyl-1-phosphate phosphatase [Paenibacillus shirakamiensis]MBP1999594.1 2-hydroxy-3-keto-5-methylthiopentenyl-1-phosphate phosphatase [Paenibacillus shirakamiensis]